MLMVQILILTITGIISASIASKKHRNPVGWFFGGFFLGIIGIVIIAVLKDPQEEQYFKNMVEQENRRLREQLHQERVKNETFRQHTYSRLDAHDDQLGVDTKSLGKTESTHKMIDEFELNGE